MTDYKNIKIPKELMDEIDKLLQIKGYASRAEFIKEAIRIHLEKFKTASYVPE